MELLAPVLILIVIGSIAFSAAAHKKHKQQEMLRLQIRRAKKNAEEVQKLFESVAEIGLDVGLYDLIGKYWLALLHQALQFAPDDPEIGVMSRHAQQLIQAAKSNPEAQAAMSDGEIKAQQMAVTGLLNHLKKFCSQGKLTAEELEEWTLYLKRKYVEVEVEAHLAQAERCITNDEKSAASTHYRYAQNKLLQSKVHGPEKNERITEIGAMAKAIYSGGNSDTASNDNPQEFPSAPHDEMDTSEQFLSANSTQQNASH